METLIDSLYYQSDCHCSNLAVEHPGIAINEEAVALAMEDIYYKKINPKTEINKGLFKEIFKVINSATREGFSRAAYNPTGEFQRQIERGNALFSAFKVHAQQNTMAARLLDDKGNLKPFSKWKKEVAPIANHHNKVWLRTEYDTAVIRAHRTADFVRFRAQSDVLPNIKWLRTSSHTPGQDHVPFWSLPVILPVNHRFWNEHRPGDRWNCKCSWRATDEPATKDITLEVPPSSMPHRGLDNNPATDGRIFNDTHPYFPKSCATCPLNGKASKLLANLSGRRKNCYECKKATQLIPTRNAEESWIKIKTKKGRVLVSSNHGEKEYDDNVNIAVTLANNNGYRIRLTGIKHNQKTADSFNETLNIAQEYKTNRKPTVSSIQNEIRKASKQADDIVLNVLSDIGNHELMRAIKGKVLQHKNIRSVTVIREGKDVYWSRERIVDYKANEPH